MISAFMSFEDAIGEFSIEGGGVGRTCEGDSAGGWFVKRGGVWASPGGDSGRVGVIWAPCAS